MNLMIKNRLVDVLLGLTLAVAAVAGIAMAIFREWLARFPWDNF